MFVEMIPNRRSKPTPLLRDWKMIDGKRHKITLANLSKLSINQVLSIKQILKGKQLVPVDGAFSTKSTIPHGHVRAVHGTLKNIQLDKIISHKSCKHSKIIQAMIVQQMIYPSSKLQSIKEFRYSTVLEECGIEHITDDDLYDAMDWLMQRKNRIEKKLARKHLRERSQVFIDLTTTSYHGKSCPLAAYGKNKEGKLPCISFSVMTDADGRPLSTDVYPGNTRDCTTLIDHVKKLQERFDLEHVTVIGDRGTITQTQIKELEDYTGVNFITALKSTELRKLVHQGMIKTSLFDKRNLAEIQSPLFPGKRLVVCLNPFLRENRAQERTILIEKTKLELDKVRREVHRRTHKLLSAGEIGTKVGAKIKKYKMGKYFKVTIEDDFFSYTINEEALQLDQALDGYYVVMTDLPKEAMPAEQVVRSYKNLSRVEQAFRCIKSINILVRPIRHRLEMRVTAHIFICMLAYYIEWHMRNKLRSVTWSDEELSIFEQSRDPVSKAQMSEKCKKKKRSKKTEDDFDPQCFRGIIHELSLQNRVINQCKVGKEAITFVQHPDETPLQKKVFELLGV